MKKMVFAAAVAALLAPTVASAQTAAQALSVKSVAVAPVRASAVGGKLKSNTGTQVGVGFGLVALTTAIIVASKSH